MTSAGNQPGMIIQVSDRERALVKDGDLHGESHLDGILPAPRGASHGEVTLEVDAGRIFTELALDNSVAKSIKITITKGDGPTSPIKRASINIGREFERTHDVASFTETLAMDDLSLAMCFNSGEGLIGIVTKFEEDVYRGQAIADFNGISNDLNLLVNILSNFIGVSTDVGSLMISRRGTRQSASTKGAAKSLVVIAVALWGTLHTWTVLPNSVQR